MNIQLKNGKYYPQNKLELKSLVSDESVYLADIDTSAITDMSGLFAGSKRENFSGIKSWDVSNVLNMADMFNGAKHFNVALDEWDLNENTDFSGIFDNTSVSFNKIFKHNKSLKKYHPKTKDELKKLVRDENVYLGDIDTSEITDMSDLFYKSKREDFSGIESWDVSNVENMRSMFYNARNFDGDLSSWDVSNVKDMSHIFYKTNLKAKEVFNVACYHPKTKDELKELVDDENVYLGDIDTSAITDMSDLFRNIWRNDFSGIESWDVSNVENMSGMFYDAKNFNGDISAWDVSNVKDMRYMFNGAKNFNGEISSWDIKDEISINDLCLRNYPENFTIPKDINGK